MNQEQENQLLVSVGIIQSKVTDMHTKVEDIVKDGCPKGKLNSQSLSYLKWALSVIIVSILSMAFFIIRASLV